MKELNSSIHNNKITIKEKVRVCYNYKETQIHKQYYISINVYKKKPQILLTIQ